jgi:uncharacterized protein involved in response to NO
VASSTGPNLNVHLHALVLDGVFVIDGHVVTFHPVGRLTREDLAAVVVLIAGRVARMLERRGLTGQAESGGPEIWSEQAPVLAAAAAASVEDRTPTLGPCHAHAGRFDLHAWLLVRAGQRDRLERL